MLRKLVTLLDLSLLPQNSTQHHLFIDIGLYGFGLNSEQIFGQRI